MQLTRRDLEIVRFILNMKFASVTDIHQKFFKVKQDGSISNNEWYVRERLRAITKYGLITSVRYHFETKCYYVGTQLGYRYVNESLEMITFDETAKPIKQIDVRTFEHDVRVMQSRLMLEELEKVTEWQSDRQLKRQYEEYFSFKTSRDSNPDGVYKSLNGSIIAFEYEIAQKSKKRYQEKIRKYVECIRQRGLVKQPKFDHVRIVCEKESVRKALLGCVGLYKDFFTIESAEVFWGRLASLHTNIPSSSLSSTSIQ